MNSKPILLIEDTSSLRTVYSSILRQSGYAVETASNMATARAMIAETKHDIVLLDLMLPDGDGMELVGEITEAHARAKVIVITANGSIYRAVEAIRAGAFDFLLKPIEEQHLLNVVMNARSEANQTAALQSAPLGGFIGSSEAMQQVYTQVRAVAGSMATVFISGENGTGKEICAEAIHALSNRSDGPFIPLNCSAIPPGFLESEMFGHLKGAFPGAIEDKQGAALQADGGTLFLDEICDMDLRLQAMLLRLLQTSCVTPLGASRPQTINTRIICATSRNPLEEVRAGRLRADLYYRLHVLPIHLPPLRERGEDVIEIAEAMLARLASREGRPLPKLSKQVRELFLQHSWPGNIRQVRNVLWNVVVLSDAPVINRAALPSEFFNQMSRDGEGPHGLSVEAAINALVGEPLGDVERQLIEATIGRLDGSVPLAARQLGVSPSTLYRKLEAWGRPASRHKP
ncbi:MAG: sigma-54-dependent transcriptional regulator [Paracoccaceae bacterium]